MQDTTRLRRRESEARIVHEVRRAGSLGRGELVRRTALPRSTVFAVVGDLVGRGVLVESSGRNGAQRGRGRPGALISLDPSAGLIAGVDIGRLGMRAVVANMAHQVVATGSDNAPAPHSASGRAVQVEALIREVCAAADLDLSSFEAVGIGIYGLAGIHESAAHHGRELCDELSRHLNVPVTAGNNTRLAALAEATWGAGRGVDDQIYVRWSTGVGGGCFIGGHLLAGAHGAAGEIGHVCADPTGPRCECGGRGCLERLIAGPALIEQCGTRGLGLDDLDRLVEAVQARVAVACDVVEQAARQLGVVLAGTVSQLDPRSVIIGGELGQLGSFVTEIVQERIDRLAMPTLGQRVAVVPAELGVNDGALGAVAQVLHTRRQPDAAAR